jgi:hypothetical protein
VTAKAFEGREGADGNQLGVGELARIQAHPGKLGGALEPFFAGFSFGYAVDESAAVRTIGDHEVGVVLRSCRRALGHANFAANINLRL